MNTGQRMSDGAVDGQIAFERLISAHFTPGPGIKAFVKGDRGTEAYVVSDTDDGVKAIEQRLEFLRSSEDCYAERDACDGLSDLDDDVRKLLREINSTEGGTHSIIGIVRKPVASGMRPERVIPPLVKVAARVLRDNALLAGHLIPIAWRTAKSTSSTGRAVPLDFDLVDQIFHERLSMAPLEEHAKILDEYRSTRPDCVDFSKWFLNARYFVNVAASTLAQDKTKPSVRQAARKKPGPKTTKPYVRLLSELLIKYPNMTAREAYKMLDDLLAKSGTSPNSTLAHPNFRGRQFQSYTAAYNDKSVKGDLDSRVTRCRPKKLK
jgi:hypothetical protein